MKIVVTGLRGFPDIQGGIETHCEELYPRLAAGGLDITVVRRKPYVVKEHPHLEEWRGVKFHDINTTKRMGFEAFIHTMRGVWYAFRHHADILHIHAIGPAITVPFAKLLGLKVVVTHHGPDYNRLKWGRFARFILRLGERFAARRADELIVISTVIRDYLLEKYNRADTHLIYNGVNRPDRIDSTEYIHSLGLKPGKYILTVGRFVKEKNFDKLILAFAAMKPSGDFQLVIAGDADHPSDFSESLKALARQYGVVLTGMIKGAQLQELYSHAGLFVLPSSHEGLPITLLEAMSYGLPVMTSDIPANRAVNLPADCYFHLDHHVVETLCDAMNNKLQTAIHHTYDLSSYDWEAIATQTAAIYKRR